MASALCMEIDLEELDTTHTSMSFSDMDFDRDSDESSVSTLSTSSSLSETFFPPSPTITSLETNCVQDLPQIIINNFNFNQISNQDLPLKFFMTKCTEEVLGTFLHGGFLDALYKTELWKLYLTELIYGYLNFVISSQQHNLWNHHEEISKIPQYPVGIIEKLRNTGKIIVLRKHVSETIVVSEKAIEARKHDHVINLKATVITPGLISQSIQFDICKYTPKLGYTSLTHLGTLIPHDIFLKGCYPMPPYEQGGFPLSPGMYSGRNCSQDSGTRTIFSRRLKKIAHSFRNPKIHYRLKICDSDKLVDLWYLKNLSDQFSTKIHVSPEYYEWVNQFISQFAECFTPDDARIHYECGCCKFSDFRRVPSDSCPLLFGCIMNTIWINGKAETVGDINLPFIHDL